MLFLPMKITALYFYPVKSLAGIRTDTLPLESAGPRWDRQWMVVDEAGKFLTQRQLPQMQLIRTAIDEEAITLRVPGEEACRVPLRETQAELRRVEVWGTEVEAHPEGADTGERLSRYLGRRVSLVRIRPAARREEAHGRSYEVRFADACPLLLCSESSLAELNRRAGAALSIERFRPNIVVAGAAPFAEDQWPGFRANNLYFESIRPCSRCAITGVDPVSAARGPEPLKTLATFRKRGSNKVEFGQYFFSPANGALTVGMSLIPEEK